MARAGARVPRGAAAADGDLDAARQLLTACGEAVVKPARGEQGKGITVGVRDAEALERAVTLAATFCPEVLVAELVAGDDLRVVVIDHRVVAAAVRRPAEVVGDGRRTVAELIAQTTRRRAGGCACGAPPTCTPAAPSTTSPTGCTRRSPRRPSGPAARSGSRSPGWTSWCPTWRAPSTSSSRPTSGRAWPTTSRSPPR